MGLYYSNDIHGVPAVLMQTVRRDQPLAYPSLLSESTEPFDTTSDRVCMLSPVTRLKTKRSLRMRRGRSRLLLCRSASPLRPSCMRV